MNRRMDQNGIRIPALQPLNGALTSVRGTIVGDPKNAAGTSIGWLAHDQIDQIVKALNAAGRAAQTEDSGVTNIPSGDVGQASAFISITISGGKNRGAPAPWPLLQTGQALFEEAFSPLRYDLPWQLESLGDLLVRQAVGSQENDFGPHDITIR